MFVRTRRRLVQVVLGCSLAFVSSAAFAKKDKDKGTHEKKGKSPNKDWDSYKGKKEDSCSDGEMKKYKKAATFEPKALEKTALRVALGPMLLPFGFDPVEFIEMIKEMGANTKYPDCYKEMMRDEAKKLQKALAENARKNGPKQFAKDPCGTPVKAWIGMLKAMEKSHVWERLPGPIKLGAYGLVGSTVPIVCTTGLAIFALKKGFTKIMEAEILPKVLEFLLEKALGKDIKAKVMLAVQRVIGVIEKVMDFTDHVMAMTDAIEKKSRAAFDAAKEKLGKTVSGWLDMTPAKFVELLRALLKEALMAVVDLGVDKLMGLVRPVVATPIEAVKAPVVSAVGTIPFVGGLLAGLITVVVDVGIELLFDLLGDGGKELLHKGIGKLVDALTKPLLSKAQAAEEPKGFKSFKKVFAAIMSTMENVMKTVANVKNKVQSLTTQMKKTFDAVSGTAAQAVPAKAN